MENSLWPIIRPKGRDINLIVKLLKDSKIWWEYSSGLQNVRSVFDEGGREYSVPHLVVLIHFFPINFKNSLGKIYDILVKTVDTEFMNWDILAKLPNQRTLAETLSVWAFSAQTRVFPACDRFYVYPLFILTDLEVP